jgi:hypothetical protein
VWQAVAESGRLKLVKGGRGILWQAVVRLGRLGRLWQAVAGCGRLWQAVSDCVRLCQVEVG